MVSQWRVKFYNHSQAYTTTSPSRCNVVALGTPSPSPAGHVVAVGPP